MHPDHKQGQTRGPNVVSYITRTLSSSSKGGPASSHLHKTEAETKRCHIWPSLPKGSGHRDPPFTGGQGHLFIFTPLHYLCTGLALKPVLTVSPPLKHEVETEPMAEPLLSRTRTGATHSVLTDD